MNLTRHSFQTQNLKKLNLYIDICPNSIIINKVAQDIRKGQIPSVSPQHTNNPPTNYTPGFESSSNQQPSPSTRSPKDLNFDPNNHPAAPKNRRSKPVLVTKAKCMRPYQTIELQRSCVTPEKYTFKSQSFRKT